MFYSLLRIKTSCGFRKLGMQHDLFVMLLVACLLSVFAISTRDCTYICLLCVLYCSEVGRFRVGVGLGAPMKVYIYIQLFLFFYKCMQSIKLRQTTENNRGPARLAMALKGYFEHQKRRQVVLTKLQYVTSWEWECVDSEPMRFPKTHTHTISWDPVSGAKLTGAGEALISVIINACSCVVLIVWWTRWMSFWNTELLNSLLTAQRSFNTVHI